MERAGCPAETQPSTWRSELLALIEAERRQADEELSAAQARARQARENHEIALRKIAEFNQSFANMGDRLRVSGSDLSPVLLRFQRQLDRDVRDAKGEIVAAGVAIAAAEKRIKAASEAAGQFASAGAAARLEVKRNAA